MGRSPRRRLQLRGSHRDPRRPDRAASDQRYRPQLAAGLSHGFG